MPGLERHATSIDKPIGNTQFEIDVAEGHKTGFYLDQRDSRHRFGEQVRRLPPINLRDLLDFKTDRKPIPIDEVESVVLHEFGHILGLAHEHNNPDAGIVWNKDKVRRDLTGPPNSWSAETVENLVFKCWERDRYPLAKPFDPHSIMAFPVPADWTENGFSIGRNLTISSGDKEFISRLYPYGAPSAPRRARTRVGRRPKPA